MREYSYNIKKIINIFKKSAVETIKTSAKMIVIITLKMQ